MLQKESHLLFEEINHTSDVHGCSPEFSRVGWETIIPEGNRPCLGPTSLYGEFPRSKTGLSNLHTNQLETFKSASVHAEPRTLLCHVLFSIPSDVVRVRTPRRRAENGEERSFDSIHLSPLIEQLPLDSAASPVSLSSSLLSQQISFLMLFLIVIILKHRTNPPQRGRFSSRGTPSPPPQPTPQPNVPYAGEGADCVGQERRRRID